MIPFRKAPPEALVTSSDQTWKPCITCGKNELIQVRKALWTCQACGQEIIAAEEDMRPDGYELMRRTEIKKKQSKGVT